MQQARRFAGVIAIQQQAQPVIVTGHVGRAQHITQQGGLIVFVLLKGLLALAKSRQVSLGGSNFGFEGTDFLAQIADFKLRLAQRFLARIKLTVSAVKPGLDLGNGSGDCRKLLACPGIVLGVILSADWQRQQQDWQD
ncbi:MAG: hypothetical protein PsegKO_14970 [Pseudohongiellaceae bacterium]